MSFQDDTVLARPGERIRQSTPSHWSVPCEPCHRPWIDPPEITPELEALAGAWDAGGHDLIREVEHGLMIDRADGTIKFEVLE